jgi:hypothetical protein
VALLLAGITGISAAWAAHVSFARIRSRASSPTTAKLVA